MHKLLMLEPDIEIRQTVQEWLPKKDLQIVGGSQSDVPGVICIHEPVLIILGPSLADATTLQKEVTRIKATAAQIPLLLVTLIGSEELAVAALRAGITEYLRFPWQPQEIESALNRCLHKDWGRKDFAVSPQRDFGKTAPIIGESAVMKRTREYLEQAAASDSTILITGETGTGKELAAEFVHRSSPRRNHPLVTINCAAIPDSLLESELFGYEQGAFTGAQASRDGKLKAAHGGTVFLDEIGDMSLLAQAKILRAIEGKEIQKLGRHTSTTINVRIIAATNREIETLVAEDKFRKDLYYRLNIARIHLPPLRERKEDIPSIASYYIQFFNRQFGRQVTRLTEQAWDFLISYGWPGNVRELKNLLEASFLQGAHTEISPDQLPGRLQTTGEGDRHNSGDEQRLLSALLSTNWNKSRAAEKLNWSRMTLYRKIAKYGVSKARFSSTSENNNSLSRRMYNLST
jgi:DNA-binding NtrC family response regulator